MLWRHSRQDIVAGTDATVGSFKQNSFNIDILLYVYNFMFGYCVKINKFKKDEKTAIKED